MIKLNKTEKKVLKLASQSPRGAVATAQCEGVVSRDLQAIRSLRAKGLMLRTNSYTEWDRSRGRTTVYLVTNDVITDEGRLALGTIS